LHIVLATFGYLAGPDLINVREHNLSYAVFEYEPEKRLDPVSLCQELKRVTDRQWKLKG
jgi:hypothetical protein